jgi:hypothetical protein
MNGDPLLEGPKRTHDVAFWRNDPEKYNLRTHSLTHTPPDSHLLVSEMKTSWNKEDVPHCFLSCSVLFHTI